MTAPVPLRVSRGDYAESEAASTDSTEIAEVQHSGSRKLGPGMQRSLCRDLAGREITRSAMARKYGVSPAYVTKFAKQRAPEIEAIRQRLEDEWAGLWIARKEARLAAYEADYEAAAHAKYASHHEWIKARTAILRAVAEELGQLPPRATLTVLPVVHIVEGVDTRELT
jgi:hypothetical protein